MFLNVPLIASLVLGVNGWVLALLASILVSLFLFKLERDLLSRTAMVSVAVLGRNESAILDGAKKTVKLAIGLNGVLVFQLVLVFKAHKLV
jgi:spore maturation protein SpmA